MLRRESGWSPVAAASWDNCYSQTRTQPETHPQMLSQESPWKNGGISSTSQLGIRPDPAKTEELEFPHSLVKNSQDEQFCNKADTKILT